jgi:hypothetical protein
MAQLFGLLGIGQNAAGNMANLRTAYDSAEVGQRSATTAGLIGQQSGATNAINALRGAYGDAKAANYNNQADRQYGYGTNYANALTGAGNNLAAAQTAAAGNYAANQGAAGANRANLAGAASQNYQIGAMNGYGNMGDAQAAGAIGVGNAINGGIGNALKIKGKLGGNFGQPSTQSPWQATQNAMSGNGLY